MITREVGDPVTDMIQASGPAQNGSSKCWAVTHATADTVQFSLFSFNFLDKTKTAVLPRRDYDRTEESFCLVDAAFY